MNSNEDRKKISALKGALENTELQASSTGSIQVGSLIFHPKSQSIERIFAEASSTLTRPLDYQDNLPTKRCGICSYRNYFKGIHYCEYYGKLDKESDEDDMVKASFAHLRSVELCGSCSYFEEEK